MTKTDRQLVVDLLNTVEALLKAHGYLSDDECEPVECECRACLEARELLEQVVS